MGLGLT